MLYQPTNMIPSAISGAGAIDATQNNVFKLQVNGNSGLVAYQLIIMKNDTLSTPVYDSGVVELATPIPPVNYKGEPQFLEATVPNTSGMINGTAYKWKAFLWWSYSSGNSTANRIEGITEPFVASSELAFTISGIDTPHTSKDVLAVMNKTGGGTISRYRWVLRNTTTGRTLNDTGFIYGQDVRYEYDGLLNGNNYELMLIAADVYGRESIATKSFYVAYNMPIIENYLDVSCIENAFNLKWFGVELIYGSPDNASYSFLANMPQQGNTSLKINAGNKVVFDSVTGQPLSSSANAAHVISFRTDVPTNRTLYEMSGVDKNANPYTVAVKILNGKLVLDVNGVTQNIGDITDVNEWFIVMIEPTAVSVAKWAVRNALYPSDSTFPSASTFPSGGAWRYDGMTTFDTDIDTDATYSALRLYGDLIVNYLWVSNVALTQNQRDRLSDYKNEPVFNDHTFMLALFDNNFKAGNLDVADDEVVGWSLYREKMSDGNLTHIRGFDIAENEITDVGIANNTEYRYYLYPVTTTGLGAPIISSIVRQRWSEWELLVCEKISDKQYIPIETYRFDGNLSTGAMSNNATKTVIKGFSKYNKVLTGENNYWSGSLHSLLGAVGEHGYAETIDLLERLKDITADARPKFLKDRKGNFWYVDISSPLTAQPKDYIEIQPTDISFEWMELGNADETSVSILPSEV